MDHGLAMVPDTCCVSHHENWDRYTSYPGGPYRVRNHTVTPCSYVTRLLVLKPLSLGGGYQEKLCARSL